MKTTKLYFRIIALLVFGATLWTACDNESLDDTLLTPVFDCPDQEANVGDVCETENAPGTINENCECEEGEVTYDCPDAEANIGDTCYGSAGQPGTINSDCECELNDEDYDCEELMLNYFWDCPLENTNGEWGIVTLACECVSYDVFCQELGLAIGDDCSTPAGGNGTVTADCNCE